MVSGKNLLNGVLIGGVAGLVAAGLAWAKEKFTWLSLDVTAKAAQLDIDLVTQIKQPKGTAFAQTVLTKLGLEKFTGQTFVTIVVATILVFFIGWMLYSLLPFKVSSTSKKVTTMLFFGAGALSITTAWAGGLWGSISFWLTVLIYSLVVGFLTGFIVEKFKMQVPEEKLIG